MFFKCTCIHTRTIIPLSRGYRIEWHPTLCLSVRISKMAGLIYLKLGIQIAIDAQLMPMHQKFWFDSKWLMGSYFCSGKIDCFVLGTWCLCLVLRDESTNWLQIWQVAWSCSPLKGHVTKFYFFKKWLISGHLFLENCMSAHLSPLQSLGWHYWFTWNLVFK